MISDFIRWNAILHCCDDVKAHKKSWNSLKNFKLNLNLHFKLPRVRMLFSYFSRWIFLIFLSSHVDILFAKWKHFCTARRDQVSLASRLIYSSSTNGILASSEFSSHMFIDSHHHFPAHCRLYRATFSTGPMASKHCHIHELKLSILLRAVHCSLLWHMLSTQLRPHFIVSLEM